MNIKTSDPSTKNKIFLGFWFVLFATLILLVNWLFHIPVQKADKLVNNIDHIEKLINKLSSKHAQFLLSSSREDNPFILSEEQIEKEARQVIRDIRISMKLVRNRSGLNRRKQMKEALSEWTLTLNDYDASLNNLILITRERGNKNSGMVKQWLEMSQQMIVLAAGNPAAIQKLNLIKQMESDYLIYRNIKTLESISITMEELRGIMDSSDALSIISTLDSYTALTVNLATIEKRLGIANSQGIVPELEKSMYQLPVVFQQISQQIRSYANRIRVVWNILSYLLILSIVCCFIYFFVQTISLIDPLKQLSAFVKKISRGELPDHDFPVGNLSDMQLIKASLKMHVETLREKMNFVRSMNNDQLDDHLELASEEDQLGAELSGLQQKIKETLLKQAKNEEDNLVRRYMNEGLAKFADILRSKNDEIHALGDAFIQDLVKYLNAIQGGFFLFDSSNPDSPVLRLISSFAYNRKKYQEQTIAYGEGLVGTCAREKHYMHLTEIPKGYITITSGLGDTPPDNLLLIPVMHENELLGVFEIASLKRFKQHEIEFSQEVAYSLGSTLVNTRNNQKTSELLSKSQQQAVEMAEQEEEMRQNMEELKATQEESGRREEELKGITDALGNALMVITYDMDGFILEVNDRFCHFMGLDRNEILGKSHLEIFNGTIKTDHEFWKNVEEKGVQTIRETIRIGKKSFNVHEHFASVQNRSNITVKYINFVTDGRTGNS